MNHTPGYGHTSTFGAIVDTNMQNMNDGGEMMPAGRSSLGFSNSRSSGRGGNSVAHNSKSGQRVSTPSIGLNPSSSRSRPSNDYG